jgi:hypothetical protein
VEELKAVKNSSKVVPQVDKGYEEWVSVRLAKEDLV